MAAESLATKPAGPPPAGQPAIRGRVLEAEIKVVVDPTRALPLASAAYAVETPEGVWLCAYYGSNRSVFDYLPQKGAEIDETTMGIAFHSRRLLGSGEFTPEVWQKFKVQITAPAGHKGE